MADPGGVRGAGAVVGLVEATTGRLARRPGPHAGAGRRLRHEREGMAGQSATRRCVAGSSAAMAGSITRLFLSSQWRRGTDAKRRGSARRHASEIHQRPRRGRRGTGRGCPTGHGGNGRDRTPDRHGDGKDPEDVPGTADRKGQDGQDRKKKRKIDRSLRSLPRLAPRLSVILRRFGRLFPKSWPWGGCSSLRRGLPQGAGCCHHRRRRASHLVAQPAFHPTSTTWLHGERWTDEVEHPDAALLRVMSACRRDRAAETTAFLLRRASRRTTPSAASGSPCWPSSSRRWNRPHAGQGAVRTCCRWLRQVPDAAFTMGSLEGPSRGSASGCRSYGELRERIAAWWNEQPPHAFAALARPRRVAASASPGSGSQAKLGQASRQPTFTMAWQDADAAPNNGMRKAMRGWLARPVHTPCAAASCHAPTILAGGRKRNNPARAKYRTTEAGIPHARAAGQRWKRAAE